MAKQITACPVSDLPPGAVTGAGPYAVGNIDGKYFAVTRRCRHLGADLASGSIEDGKLVCPWHQSACNTPSSTRGTHRLGPNPCPAFDNSERYNRSRPRHHIRRHPRSPIATLELDDLPGRVAGEA